MQTTYCKNMLITPVQIQIDISKAAQTPLEAPRNQEAEWASRSTTADGNLEVDSDPYVYYEVMYEPFFTDKSHPVGQFCYDPPNQSLTMINKNIALHRRCLLLGYTNKKEDKQQTIIGQFGMLYVCVRACVCV